MKRRSVLLLVLVLGVTFAMGCAAASGLGVSDLLSRQAAVSNHDGRLRLMSVDDLERERDAKLSSQTSGRALVIEVSRSGQPRSSVISACIDQKTKAFFAPPCRSSERRISWNSQGPRGAAGASGGAGSVYYEISTTGTLSPSTQTGNINIYCSLGGKAIAGSWSATSIATIPGVNTSTGSRDGWTYNLWNNMTYTTLSYYLETTCIV